MNLIISTLGKNDKDLEQLIDKFKQNNNTEIIYTENMNIKGCIGCNNCWLVTIVSNLVRNFDSEKATYPSCYVKQNLLLNFY